MERRELCKFNFPRVSYINPVLNILICITICEYWLDNFHTNLAMLLQSSYRVLKRH